MRATGKLMRLFNKLFCLIIAFISLSGIAFADPIGLVFDWQPFIIVNDCRDVNHPVKRILPENSFNYREISKKINNSNEFLPNDLKIISNSPVTMAGKSALRKIKVSFSTLSSFMLPYDEIHSRGYDGKLSRAVSILPSLLLNPSQEVAIETLKLIEPQVNLGFEF